MSIQIGAKRVKNMYAMCTVHVPTELLFCIPPLVVGHDHHRQPLFSFFVFGTGMDAIIPLGIFVLPYSIFFFPLFFLIESLQHRSEDNEKKYLVQYRTRRGPDTL